MTSLPKRGDRVRVTEVLDSELLKHGAELVLMGDAATAMPEGFVTFYYEGEGAPYSGRVRVEILERAGDNPFDECRKCLRQRRHHRGAGDALCSVFQLKPKERASTKALREAKESIERLATTSVYQAKQDAAAEFARGMRRAVEIAERLSDPAGHGYGTHLVVIRELKEVVEKELADG